MKSSKAWNSEIGGKSVEMISLPQPKGFAVRTHRHTDTPGSARGGGDLMMRLQSPGQGTCRQSLEQDQAVKLPPSVLLAVIRSHPHRIDAHATRSGPNTNPRVSNDNLMSRFIQIFQQIVNFSVKENSEFLKAKMFQINLMTFACPTIFSFFFFWWVSRLAIRRFRLYDVGADFFKNFRIIQSAIKYSFVLSSLLNLSRRLSTNLNLSSRCCSHPNRV